MASEDDNGEYDCTLADPNYQLLARQAAMYREGGFGLCKDPSQAGIYFFLSFSVLYKHSQVIPRFYFLIPIINI